MDWDGAARDEAGTIIRRRRRRDKWASRGKRSGTDDGRSELGVERAGDEGAAAEDFKSVPLARYGPGSIDLYAQ